MESTIIPFEELLRGNSRLFQGSEYGDIPVSFFLVHTAPGGGPKLHQHPYAELFVVQAGRATFTIGDTTREGRGGQIVIGPANIPHKFKNSGEEPLQMINIHPSKEVSTEWLED